MEKDFYDVLGIRRNADSRKIKEAYRAKAKMYHPDVVHSENADRFREVEEAYDTLKDENRRREYDGKRKSGQVSESGPSVRSRWSPIWERHEAFSDVFIERDWDSLFRRFGMGRKRTRELEMEITLSPQEASAGGNFPVTVPSELLAGRRGIFDSWNLFFSTDELIFTLPLPPHIADGSLLRVKINSMDFGDLLINITVRVESAG